ncbi:hypothetical protein PG993_008933 [Apiospora rasikravindrae]|uniref:C2H2-type domain-containing protein n=1 Tax=Apiospora rasikravindrae TaxID=990691 RepID=A0ABR1SRH6_9PEZI
MAQPNPPGHASSSKAPAGKQYVCQICNKVMSSEKSLQRHNQAHNKTEICGKCGTAFATSAKLKAHQFRIHKINKSNFVCYMPGCDRSGFGFKTQTLLYNHLDRLHQGATATDNDQAAADSGIKLTGESSSEGESEGDEDDAPTADEEEHSAEKLSDKEVANANGDQQRPSSGHYEHRYRVLKRRMAKEQLRHRKEVVDIYNRHGGAIENLKRRVAQLEQRLNSQSPE